MKNRSVLSDIQSFVSSTGVKSPNQIKGSGALGKRITAVNKQEKESARAKSKAAGQQKKVDAKKASDNAKEAKAVVSKDTKQHNKTEKREKKYAKTSSEAYKGRKHIVDTEHGPAVDLDAVERSSSKKKVPTKPKGSKKK